MKTRSFLITNNIKKKEGDGKGKRIIKRQEKNRLTITKGVQFQSVLKKLYSEETKE